ncbi:hypothetical protein BPAE_0098g00020 [Botrytis paeoniae]|uniref:Uncharacterized protein n=1 Tax=Botrytis paeoniae TaxID=278948 RepID=A0A4Z1FQ49_9HELO|nr:hypothetical protein BPAE_0098g00020 [Botrytis paeoniae]
MSRRSSANHNSRPASTHQSVNQQLTTLHSRASDNESVAGTSDSHRSSNDYGRVRESINIFGRKVLSSSGRQERRDEKEIANSREEREQLSAEIRRKVLEGRRRDEQARRRERLEEILEEKDKVQEERRAQEIEGSGGWYQHDLEKREKIRQQRKISRRIAALPPRQRVREERRIAKRTEEERIQRDKSRKERIAGERHKLKREDDIQKGKELLGEESQLLRLDSAWERGFDVRREDVRRWVLGLTYRPYDYLVVSFCSRIGSRPSIPLPRQRPSGPQLHRPVPPPLPLPPPPSQSSQSPRPPKPTHPPPPPPRRRRRPASSPPHNTNSPPRTQSERIPPPPRRSRHNQNPDLREPRSSSRGRSHRSTSKHTFTISNIAQHNENKNSSINNTPTAKEHTKSKDKDKKFISRTSRIKTSGRARVKDCMQAGADVGRVV